MSADVGDLGWQAGVIGYNPERGITKDRSTKVWSQLVKQF